MKTMSDKDFFIQWKNKKVAIHCKTEEHANEFCKIMDANGLTWDDGESYLVDTYWNIFKEDTCYCFNIGAFGNKEQVEEEGYTLLEFDGYVVDTEKPTNVMIHKEIITELHDVYKAKNEDYGNSFAKTRAEYPEAILIRLSDKLERLKTLYKQDAQVKDESVDDTLLDLANYAIMELVERRMQND